MTPRVTCTIAEPELWAANGHARTTGILHRLVRVWTGHPGLILDFNGVSLKWMP